MNEQTWIKSRSFLKLWSGRAWPQRLARKMRLFGCACCRRLGPLLTDERSLRALETAERYADGLVSEEALKAARLVAFRAAERFRHIEGQPYARYWAASAVEMATHLTLPDAFGTSAVRAAIALDKAKIRRKQVEDAQQADLLRDIIGNPFWPPALDPAWRSPAAVALARAIYQDRDFSVLPVLADALEDAGCIEPEILSHCRAGGEHAKGCWVVDLVIARS